MARERLKEKDLETDIAQWLCGPGGYAPGDPARYDRRLALDPATLLEFVKTTQPHEWQRHERNYPGKADKAFLDRFCQEVSNRSLLEVLRNGVRDRGNCFRVVFWKPETELNADSLARYRANILHCTRQLRYSPSCENSVDIALFVNGIPVVALELKNPLTGQTVEDAMRQFRQDRSPDDLFFDFKRRVLACFAVDPLNVRMTTKLEGQKTAFLPFDQGSNGAGHVGGAGNPQGQGRAYPVAHLWENILTRDALLELLQKYLLLQTKKSVNAKTGQTVISEKLIFPRYHQWDVVHGLIDDVKARGPGVNYLIQHSAGSGKSNSIAWLAHRLSGLHDAENRKIFTSVIVVTDRKVLDNQLQATVGQFEQTQGLVVKVDQDSRQLRDAINNGAAVIVTTLQKFPVIFDEVERQKANFAVIVDEAHSSQTGQAAIKLKAALADPEAALDEYARQENKHAENEELKSDNLLLQLAAQGQHKNLSFFAFTATPKAKTLELFGKKSEQGKFEAWHVYSMRQAIEEGFILDVLKNYATWQRYYQLLRKITDDPQYATAAGMRAAARFASLHPRNIAQKTEVMLDHFCNVTLGKMGGQAKAMLVTPSRLHAVRYMREFVRQIREKKLACVRPLVAFSGEVQDDGMAVTEPMLNEQAHGVKISEKQLPDAFAGDFNILIVAEKYQTGFDEPKLHTMFVDKKLGDVKAVQTLSRLNRTCPGKEDTFILDFENTQEDIQKAFQPYYEATFLEEETDPNLLYDVRSRLDAFGIYSRNDVENVGKLLEKKTVDIADVLEILGPLREAYQARPEQERLDFRTGLFRFVRLYGFITQLTRMFDADLHKYAFFCRWLARVLPKEGDGPLDLAGQIDLEFYQLKKTGQGAIRLEHSEDGLSGIKGDAGASARQFSPLSDIVDKINKRFGTQFNPEDQVHALEQITSRVIRVEPRLSQLVGPGDQGMWDIVYNKAFEQAVAASALENAKFFDSISTPDILNFLKMELKQQVLEKIAHGN